jgi:Spaetzle
MVGDEGGKAFNCEHSFDTEMDTNGFRLNSEENFELQALSCLSSKRFIVPRALNNVNNHLTQIVNSENFIQKLQITECRNLRDTCNEHAVEQTDFRHICWQEYLIVKLLAYKDDATMYEEDFYYPAHCSCRLIKVTRSIKR